MKYFYITLTLLFLTRLSIAQTYTQYFDGADTGTYSIAINFGSDSTNIWQIGKPQKHFFDSAATAPNALITDTLNYYPVNDTSSFTIKTSGNNWSFYNILALRWKQKLDMDSATDGGLIEFKTSADSAWHSIFDNPYVYNFYGFEFANKNTLPDGRPAFSGTDSVWRDIWLCYSLSWVSQFDSVLLRFTFISDSINNNKEGWLIDNMIAHVTFVHTISEVKQEKYLNVYPNPANDILHIETKKLMEYHLIEDMVLINAVGQVVDQWKNIPTKFFIKTAKYPNGMYQLKVKTNIQSETVPFIIQHK